jgi:hypothetical protein
MAQSYGIVLEGFHWGGNVRGLALELMCSNITSKAER